MKKIYILNEHQLNVIQENIVTETISEFNKGDRIQLLSPIDGYNIPIKSVGTVMHIDAIGTIRARFKIGNEILLVPINPDIDKIIKMDQITY